MLESYVNGVHIFDKPQVWLFPVFPWAAFAFTGLAVGFWLFTDLAKRREEWNLVALLGATGEWRLACPWRWIDGAADLYAVYDTGTPVRISCWRDAECAGDFEFGVYGARWGLGQVGFSL